MTSFNQITCSDCGESYPIDPEDESADDHAEDCPIRSAFVKSGRWDA